ncbi:MAG: hypothetical protein E4G89_06480 [Methanothrix sp.]|nr:MAG: hypothetical protein E4G89_06480 [Methanothrix sp.]
MESGEVSQKRTASDVCWAQIVCVETFPKEGIRGIDEKISSIEGLSLVKSPPRSNLNLMSDRLSLWKCEDPEACFGVVLRSAQNWGGSRDLFSKYVLGITVESIDSGALPYYVVAWKIDLNPDTIGAASNLAKDLSYLRNPFRVFLESFDGFSKVAGGMSPCVPAITIIAACVEQKSIDRMREIAACIIDEPDDEREIDDRGAFGDKLRELEPFDLDPTRQKDMKSHILLEQNVTLILGNADPYSVFLRSPYMVLLSSTKGLLDPDPFRLPIAPYLTNSPLEQIWLLPHVLIVPMSTLAWFRECWTRVETLQQKLSKMGADISSDLSKLTSDEIIQDLIGIELKLSATDMALGLLQRGYGRTFETWANNSTRGHSEIFVPSMKHWHSSREAPELNSGYLGALGSVLETNLDMLTKQVKELGKQANILSDRAHEARLSRSIQATEEYTKAVRDSSNKMESMTNTLLSSQDWMTYLTAVLIVLTGMLVIVGFLSSDMGENTWIAYIALFLLVGFIAQKRLLTSAFISVAIAFLVFAGGSDLWEDVDAWLRLAGSCLSGILAFPLFWKLLPNLGKMTPRVKGHKK